MRTRIFPLKENKKASVNIFPFSFSFVINSEKNFYLLWEKNEKLEEREGEGILISFRPR